MKYISTITHQSKTDPEVSFTVRHLTEGRRIKISLALADKYDKIDAIQRSAVGLSERVKPLIDAAKDGGALEWNDDMIALFRANARVKAVENDEILPVFVRELLVSVVGLDIDGAPATPETMVENGPPELYAEIAKAVRFEMGMSETETGNSEPPSTSTALADGATQVSSAETASVAETPA